MNKLRFYFALWIAKFVTMAMKLLGRNASYLPGKIALKISKDFLGHLKAPKTVIAVTGTNGKTTVSNLLSSVLTKNGYQVTNNSLGSNVQAGVTAALLQDSDMLGRAKKDIAVLEVDERSSLLIYPYIKPDYLLCNNIMRDSLSRNAHTEFISYIINKALPPSTKVILNADDLVCATLAPQNKQRVYFGLDVEKTNEDGPAYLQDIVYCPQCGNKLENEYIRYNHIGRMYCSNCDFHSPVPDYVVTRIDRQNNLFTVAHKQNNYDFRLINDNLVNLYNFCGLVAILSEIGLSYEQICAGFDQSHIVKTRFDNVRSGDLSITMQLSKGENPTASARCFSYVSKCPGEDKAIIVVGDDFMDSENICWLYDSNYSYLKDPSINQIIFSGPRAKDQLLRAQLADVPTNKIKIIENSKDGATLLDTSKSKNIYVLYGPYMVKTANTVKNQLIQLGKEKV